MSDIAGPPAPKDVQPSVRSADKASYVAKDPNNSQARSHDTPQERSSEKEQEALKARDPAVSIAAKTAHLQSGQEITEKVARVDPEGRPIVVTNEVTIALKPDAGLKPNDEVHLRVVEADSRISADLLRQNEHAIDPPIRVSVTVIEVHQPLQTEKQAPATPKVDQPYQAPQSPAAGVTSVTQTAPPTDDVALLIASQNAEKLAPSTANPLTPTATTTATETPVPQTPSSAASTVRASSADLATLINQQQGSASTASSQSQGIQAPPSQGTNVLFGPAAGPGIGPAIIGVTVKGAPAIVQLLDPAQSKVSPAEVATVVKVQNLSATEARALPVGATALAKLADAAGELARVDTSRGSFVLPAQTAATLADELVRVVVDQAPAGASAPQAPAATTYAAQFVPTGSEAATRVSLVFPKQTETLAQTQQGTVATTSVQSVQTVSAFLSPSGPKTDLKIITDVGVLTLTVPSAFRPEAGVQLLINEAEPRPVPAATQASGTIPPLQIPETVAAQATASTVAAHTPNMLASWPAMEESVAALAGSGQAAGAQESVASKSAQGGAKLTNSLLFFLAAAGRGGPDAWLGQSTQQALGNASPTLLKTLQSDLRRMAALPGEAIGEWRPIILPFDARGTEVPLAALLYQGKADIDPDAEQDNENTQQDNQENSQRFILQVQFSVLGDIQLDGDISRTKFDLTVRSGSSFSTPLKQDLEGLFYNALSANGFAGGLSFDEGSAFEVDAAKLIESHLTQAPAS